jgi:hypothetical protein
VVSDTPFYTANPLLFSSIHLRDNFPSELLSGMDLRTVLNATSIPSIISSIPNRQLVKCAKYVKSLSNEVLASSRTAVPVCARGEEGRRERREGGKEERRQGGKEKEGRRIEQRGREKDRKMEGERT